MSVVTRAASKLKFETGDAPSQTDFTDLHDSVVFQQETIIGKRWGYLTAQWNSTTMEKWGMTALSFSGTATTRTPAVTNLQTITKRLGFVSAATAGQAAHFRSQEKFTARGNAAGIGGADVNIRFGISQTQTGYYFYSGLCTDLSPFGATLSPLDYTEVIGVSFRQGTDTNFQVCHNDAAGQATFVNTGIAPSTSTIYRVRIYFEPNSSDVLVELTDLSTDTKFSTTINTNLPTSTTLLTHQTIISNNTTAGAVSLELVDITIVTPT